MYLSELSPLEYVVNDGCLCALLLAVNRNKSFDTEITSTGRSARPKPSSLVQSIAESFDVRPAC